MDETNFLEGAEFVIGEASEQGPPSSPEMELLGWQSNSSFMHNFLLAATEVPPPPAHLPDQPPQLLVPMPELPLLPPSLAHSAAAQEAAPAGEADAAAVNDDHQFLAGQAITESTREDDKGKRPLLAERLPPLPEFTISDIQAETCIVRNRVKQMSFSAWADETGLMTEMPKVTTTGDGPFGKRIEGFTYQFGKGGDIGMMCFCHGNFFSPAEFITHAGGNPAPNPLRQIEVFFPSVDHLLI